jgi:hypothetical protein
MIEFARRAVDGRSGPGNAFRELVARIPSVAKHCLAAGIDECCRHARSGARSNLDARSFVRCMDDRSVSLGESPRVLRIAGPTDPRRPPRPA